MKSLSSAPRAGVWLCLVLLPTPCSSLAHSSAAAARHQLGLGTHQRLHVRTLNWRTRRHHQPFIDEVLQRIAASNITTPGGENSSQYDQLGVRSNGYGDDAVLRSTLIISGGGSMLLGVLFCILRRLAPVVYSRALADGSASEPAAEFLSAKSGGPLSWMLAVWFRTADQEVDAAGLDGWSLLEFYRFNFRILSLLGPVIMLTLLPVHYLSFQGDWRKDVDVLSRFDIGMIPSGSRLWWLHGVFVWFVVVGCGAYLVHLQRGFLKRRFVWLKTLPEPRCTTVMIEGVPAEYRSDRALKDYFVHHFAGVFHDAHEVKEAYVVRKTERLCEMREELKTVAGAVTFAQRVRERSEYMSSNLETLETRKDQLARRVRAEQARVQQGVDDKDTLICSSSAFVTFSNEVVQRMALNEKYRFDRTAFVISAPPDPSDVNYEMLSQDHSGWESVGWLCLILLFVSWSPVVVFISGLTTLSTLSENVPLVRSLCTSFPGLSQVLEGVLATAALKLFLAFLPAILLSIISRFFKVHSGALAQLRLERWYFSFLVIFVLLVTILGRSIVITVAQIVEHPTQLLELLASSLPGASHFYFNYVIFGWFTVAFELLRIMNLLKYAWFRYMYSLDPQVAKVYCEPEDPSSYGLGARMALAALMSAITFVFCTCSPLILAFAWLYFAVGRLAYGYLLVHVETKKPDLGGFFWVESQRQIFFVLFIYVLLMTGILATSAGQLGPPVLAIAAVLPLYYFCRQFHQLGWKYLPLEEMVRCVTLTRADASGASGYLVAQADGSLSEVSDGTVPEATFEITPLDGAAILKSSYGTYVSAHGCLVNEAGEASKLARAQLTRGEQSIELAAKVYKLQPARLKVKENVGRYVQPECEN